MARKIWVMAASPTGQFYQDVLDDDTGEIVTEHCRAETVGGKAVPVPMQLTDTPALRRALMEFKPGTEIPSSIVEPSRDQIDAHLGSTAAPAPAAAPVAAAAPSTAPASSPSPAAATVDSGATVSAPASADTSSASSTDTSKGKK